MESMPFDKDVQVEINFDKVCEKLTEILEQHKGVLLYCRDGEVISPAFVIAFLMYRAKLDINTATLKVCQATGRVEICKWIYTQLLLYKPKH